MAIPARNELGCWRLNALISHGATDVINDASIVRGQASPEMWSQIMSGYKPSTPKVPFVYEKFVNQLKGSGINVIRDGGQVHIMALTDRDIDVLAGNREIKNSETVDWRSGLVPKQGGLFDEKLTGGHNGRRWSFIRLHEPMPNPVMEEPIRRVLGLTRNEFNDVIAGKRELAGNSGPSAVASALKKIDLNKEIARAREEIKSGKRTLRGPGGSPSWLSQGCQTSGHPPRGLGDLPKLPYFHRRFVRSPQWGRRKCHWWLTRTISTRNCWTPTGSYRIWRHKLATT